MCGYTEYLSGMNEADDLPRMVPMMSKSIGTIFTFKRHQSLGIYENSFSPFVRKPNVSVTLS
ncbi:hypothetical protein DFP97_10684 [Paenibacillus prosopidis]|uniref:Uncharacterized protein n=1 Tax=Paenibacillus prosopidis TaxID=630520 RepID=A0A368W7H1_9BACL|nr:hypothetical protein DFP97_10684 [Paenibacillus prosopidis]